MGITILKGGLLTTVQDTGRRGYQRYGMSVSGAVDLRSCIYANILVGNPDSEAVLEATLFGPQIEFTSRSVIAVTGGNLSPVLNGVPMPMYRAVRIEKGDILAFGNPKSGCRAYIAFAGGLAIPPAMGSRSTYLKAGLGGYEGRKLAEGDEIAFRHPASCPANTDRRYMEPPVLNGAYTVRVLPGPQEDRFTEEGMKTFLSGTYTVTNEFDRMGCRLSGPKIEHRTDGNIISDGISFGAVQVPDGGEPIVMLADRQTTGGYTKIACVISADLPLIAQCKAGDTIRFTATDIETAQDAYIEQQKKYASLRSAFDAEQSDVPLPPPFPHPDRVPEPVPDDPDAARYRISVDGKPYSVSVTRLS